MNQRRFFAPVQKYVELLNIYKPKALHFALLSSLLLLSLLGLHHIFNQNVYVVSVDGKELGIVKDADEIETFLADLTIRCSELHGMKLHPQQTISLVKENRGGTQPQQAEELKDVLRQEIKMVTDAFYITIEGEMIVPVSTQNDFQDIVEGLIQAYRRDHANVELVEGWVVEELDLISCAVPPDKLHSPEDAIALILNNPGPEMFTASLSVAGGRGILESRHLSRAYGAGYSHPADDHAEGLTIQTEEQPPAAVTVETIEKMTVTEEIPFSTEVIPDEDLWVLQKNILTPGVDGEKTTVYQVTRRNGVEIERQILSEEVTKEPVTQVEKVGTAKVPSKGTGKFIWPVEGGGEISPGRGFSAYHTGIDICANPGTNVLAADDGVVWFAGRGGSQGNYIIIYHGGYWTLYLHNQVNLVKRGARVSQGDVIAKVGSTGRSTGPHLHFEVRQDDGTGEWIGYYQHQPLDPLRFFRP